MKRGRRVYRRMELEEEEEEKEEDVEVEEELKYIEEVVVKEDRDLRGMRWISVEAVQEEDRDR